MAAVHYKTGLFPIFKSVNFVTKVPITEPTARRILVMLRRGGILKEIRAGSGRRPTVLTFLEVLNIAEGKPVF